MRLTVSGLTKRIDEMREMAARARDLSPAMQAAAEAVVKHVSDRFRSKTDPEGAPWQPLAQSTVARRRKGSSSILTDTGVLKNSIAVTSGKRSVTFGTNVPYAGIHQFGGRAGRGGSALIPRRSYLPVVRVGAGFAFPKGGPAGQLAARIRRYLSRYILTGKVA